MNNTEELWDDIRVTTDHLSELSIHLREAAAEVRRAAFAQQQRDNPRRLELLESLKKLVDQVRDILWRELRSSTSNTVQEGNAPTRAAELFALLAKMGAVHNADTTVRSFFEEIESTVDRALTRSQEPGSRSSGPHSEAA